MSRLLVVGVFIVLAVDIFAAVDVSLTDRNRVRALPKVLWIITVMVLPVLGAVLWFTLGKARTAGTGRTRPIAPDDDPDFLRKMRLQEEQDERIRRLEKELADLDDDDIDKPN